jgi:hypothetical protein
VPQATTALYFCFKSRNFAIKLPKIRLFGLADLEISGEIGIISLLAYRADFSLTGQGSPNFNLMNLRAVIKILGL